ncbi:MAG: hypothetical protein OXC63_08350 [Aestuariivita sp.]|nr:hypothetical protein [Aestuariivita sp.]MCY4345402.1 hypothetical protein [Aestuariivita sp.]
MTKPKTTQTPPQTTGVAAARDADHRLPTALISEDVHVVQAALSRLDARCDPEDIPQCLRHIELLEKASRLSATRWGNGRGTGARAIADAVHRIRWCVACHWQGKVLPAAESGLADRTLYNWILVYSWMSEQRFRDVVEGSPKSLGLRDLQRRRIEEEFKGTAREFNAQSAFDGEPATIRGRS